MTHIIDTLDIISNLESIYESDKSFRILKDFERVIDELGIYVYANWKEGELAEGPKISRHWITCSFMWPRKEMPDPMGGKRLLDYDCKIKYIKSHIIVPRQIRKPDDMRPGTKKGKLDKKPIWLVEIRMPISLIREIYMANDSFDIDSLETENEGTAMAPPPPAPGGMTPPPPAGGAPAPDAAAPAGDAAPATPGGTI